MINLIGPPCISGYGLSLINILEQLGDEVALFPIGMVDPPEESRGVVRSALDRAKFYDDAAPSVRIYHAFGQAEPVGRGPKVGYPFFEIDPLQPNEVHHANKLDMLLVASGWAADVSRRSGVTVPIRVVPLGVDRRIFHEGIRVTRTDADTVFLNVGKFTLNKGHDFLIEAFNRAFTPRDPVKLLAAGYNVHIGDRGNAHWKDLYEGSPLGVAGKVRVLPRLRTQHDVALLMASSDVGVFPARAEGWNLDLLEMLSCGKPVIATSYSAHTEFCTPENSSLIPVDGLEEANDGIWFHGEGYWAHLGDDQMDFTVEAMRSAHKAKLSGDLGVNRAGIETAIEYSWANTVAVLRSTIEELR